MLCMKQKKIAKDLAHWIESQKITGDALVLAIELTFENHFELKDGKSAIQANKRKQRENR